jgi:hypothetical protein
MARVTLALQSLVQTSSAQGSTLYLIREGWHRNPCLLCGAHFFAAALKGKPVSLSTVSLCVASEQIRGVEV